MNENCKECFNYQKYNFLGKEVWMCMANVNYPDKCVLGKARKTLKNLEEKVFKESYTGE